MTPEQIAEQDAATAAAKAEAEKAEATPSHDPLQKEAEKVQKNARTEKEKAEFSLKKNAERLKELGGDPTSILGSHLATEDDDKPLTVGMLKEIQKENGKNTALDLADSLDDENEKVLVKDALENRIKPSGNPQEDLTAARAIVNAKRNALIAEEAGRRSGAAGHASGAGAPAKGDNEAFEPTPEETAFMKPPFNLSKDAIIAARKSQS